MLMDCGDQSNKGLEEGLQDCCLLDDKTSSFMVPKLPSHLPYCKPQVRILCDSPSKPGSIFDAQKYAWPRETYRLSIAARAAFAPPA